MVFQAPPRPLFSQMRMEENTARYRCSPDARSPLPRPLVDTRVGGGWPLTMMRGVAGFSMIELIVVMIIVSILAVVGLSRMDLMSGYNEVVYRDKVKATLEYARRSAIAHRRVSCVTVSANEVSLKVEENQPETTGSGTCASGGGLSAHNLNLPTPDKECSGATNAVCPPSGVTLSDAQIGFNGLGQPLSSAGAVLTADTVWTITDTKTGGTATLTVAAESGYVY